MAQPLVHTKLQLQTGLGKLVCTLLGGMCQVKLLQCVIPGVPTYGAHLLCKSLSFDVDKCPPGHYIFVGSLKSILHGGLGMFVYT